ncbi:hypothetical protein ACFCXS_18395 [Streptomyces sp. NPDC056373]
MSSLSARRLTAVHIAPVASVIVVHMTARDSFSVPLKDHRP